LTATDRNTPAFWQPLAQFRDSSVPKLFNLRTAERAGIAIPQTWWIAASIPEPPERPPDLRDVPMILRSGSPDEDTASTSKAGQFLSLPVAPGEDFAAAFRRVVDALPKDDGGMARGVVFAQPLLAGESAGIAFFDGYYYERASAAGENTGLTAGAERGDVVQGQLQRGDPWSSWLTRVGDVFRNLGPIDIEWLRSGGGYVLLQARPALFPVTRNRILSLANHKEILGDPPSPWIVSALEAVSDGATEFFAEADPAVRDWREPYAVVVAERAWMNFSFFFRLMDHWGLPRTMVTEGVGGSAENAEDGRADLPRMIRSSPALLRLQWRSFRVIAEIPRLLDDLRADLESRQSLPELHGWCVKALQTALRVNFAINGPLSGLTRVRRFLRIRGGPEVVTHRMMVDYEALTGAPDREAALDAWLERYGHRGPLESDPMQPRFREIRHVLLADLLSRPESPQAASPPHPASHNPFFLLDRRREWFRDELMRLWERLRGKMLAEGTRLQSAGSISHRDDVFQLRERDLNDPGGYQDAIARNRAAVEAVIGLSLPLTATFSEIRAALDVPRAAAADGETAAYRGVSLKAGVFTGRAVKAESLLALLERAGREPSLLGEDAVLVVPALEPSWAVVFLRVGAVVAEIGGELSHAAILLREARKPAVVNCQGIYGRISEAAILRLDGDKGVVSIEQSPK
jgi:pyruvate,water dikinase